VIDDRLKIHEYHKKKLYDLSFSRKKNCSLSVYDNISFQIQKISSPKMSFKKSKLTGI
jgi:hypothetical protein